ncbi:DNA repair protein RAD51D [Skeletonema marinoi]|uniref:DNA repair protein RAD51D n=1 Tax=Skeletonema marinoi TaxID=267567 RepID=A0AAD8Y4S0_9STRA|nr:DNA repair protein RAD51D [Skeletonema marinoi]
MPTMRQTGINPETHEKLCGTKRALSPSSSFVPIRTPSALLARDPHQLSSSLQVSLDSIKKLRSTVAECVVMDPFVGHGGRAAEIMEGVSTFCRNNATTNNNNNDGQEKNDNDDDDRPPPMTAGAVTALDLYAQTLLTKRLYLNTNNKQHSPSLEYISTGSSALDQLLLPDTTYSSFEEGCNLSSSPFHIPTLDCYNNNNNLSSPTLNNNNHTSSSCKGGIPYGQITELSGKTSSGKTQLALTITAHALLVNNLQVKYLIAGGGGGSSRMAISRRLSAICIGVARSQLLWKRRQQQQQQRGEGNQEIDGNNIMMNIDKEAKLIASKCLERVTIAIVHDAYSLLGSLVQIENEELSYRTNNPHHCDDNNQKGTLVVIDSISGCLGHHIYSDLTLGASLSNQVSLTLRQMTRSFDGHFDSGTTATSTDVLCQNPPRRFAVVVINGTVGKGANDNSGSELNNGMKTSSSSSSYKPAMGRYWHGGDMGLWLEENDDEAACSGNGNSTAMSFYDGNVPGLSRSSEKVVTVTLQWHYGKSLGDVDGSARGEECGGRHEARFVIRAGGVADV